MPRLIPFAVFLAFLSGCAVKQSAQEDPNDPKVIIRKAIEAHGGEENLSAWKAFAMKSRGLLYMNGKSYPVTYDSVYQLPDSYKAVVTLDRGGYKTTISQGYHDGKGWMKKDKDAAYPVGSLNLEIMKATAHKAYAMMFVPLLRDESYTLATLPETTVNNRPAVGVKVSTKGQRDLKLYFDKETYVQAKQVGPSLDSKNFRIVEGEVIFLSMIDFDGVLWPAKSVHYEEGQKESEGQVIECKRIEPLDPSAFQMPR